jgi:hypothetical protein
MLQAVSGCSQGKNTQAGNFPHFSSFLCYPSLTGRLRYPRDSNSVGSSQFENYYDLYPLRARQNGERAEKSFGFLTACTHHIFHIEYKHGASYKNVP